MKIKMIPYQKIDGGAPTDKLLMVDSFFSTAILAVLFILQK